MKNLTAEQMQRFSERAQQAAQELHNGKDVRELMAQLYVEGLEGKSTQQGLLIADSILDAIDEFDVGYEEIRADATAFLEKFQEEVEAGKSCCERCNFYLQLAAALSVGEDEEADEIAPVSEAEATPALEQELRESVMDAISDSGVLFASQEQRAELLEQLTKGDANETAQQMLDISEEATGLRALVSMVTYIAVKNGEVEGIPAETTAADIATMVCTAAEEAHIVEEVRNGNMAETVAEVLLSTLGTLFILLIARKAISLGIAYACAFPAIICYPMTAMILYLACSAICKIIPKWHDDAKTAVSIASFTLRGLAFAMRSFARYAQTTILPAVRDRVMNLVEKIKGRVTRRSAQTVTG